MPDRLLPRVLVTRAPHQGSELAERLRALGAEPVLIPAIEIVPPASFAALDGAVAQLATFDWLLFTSANAVDAFSMRLNGCALPTPRPRIAAIGPSTARTLGSHGFTLDLVPPRAVAESLTEALQPFARTDEGRPTRFLLLRAEDGREHLPETLRVAGAEVIIAPAYRTVIPSGSIELLRTMLEVDQGSALDAITFTSSSTARNLVALAAAASVSLPETAARISIGPITSQTLRELGLPPHAEAPEATTACLAETTMATIRSSTGLHSN